MDDTSEKSAQAGAKQRIFVSILDGRNPDKADIAEIYGKGNADRLFDHISLFVKRNGRIGIRRERPSAPASRDIRGERARIENDPAFDAPHRLLLSGTAPSVRDLEPLYGAYAPAVEKAFHVYVDRNIRRKCLIPSASHLNRVGAVVYALGMDDDGTRRYAAIGALHDVIEDLLTKVTTGGRTAYGIERYSDFVLDFVPPDLIAMVELLTNRSGLLIEVIGDKLKEKGYSFNKRWVLVHLDELRDSADSELHGSFDRLRDFLGDMDAKDFDPESVAWKCYQHFYISDLATKAHREENYRPFEIKAVDLADNAIGRDALALDGRIRNLIKIQTWVKHGRDLNPSWPPLIRRLDELQEDALSAAEDLVRDRLFRGVASADYITSAFETIAKLESVFYE